MEVAAAEGHVAATVAWPKQVAGVTAEIIQSLPGESGGNNSVVLAREIQSLSEKNQARPTEKRKTKNDDDGDDWRFEIKRKERAAGRKNTGSTARGNWYYWVIRIRKSDGATLYYGTLDVLDARDPQRLAKYWQRSRKRKVSKNARPGRRP